VYSADDSKSLQTFLCFVFFQDFSCFLFFSRSELTNHRPPGVLQVYSKHKYIGVDLVAFKRTINVCLLASLLTYLVCKCLLKLTNLMRNGCQGSGCHSNCSLVLKGGAGRR